MENLRIVADINQAPLVEPGTPVVAAEPMVAIGVLPDGMESGLPSVHVRVDTPTGPVIGFTSARLFLAAADALRARYGHLLG